MFAIVSITTANQEIKRSRFVATAAPVVSMEAAKEFVAQYSVTDANHNCWAWRIGQNYRFSDDGEPSGTAGKPILQAIDGLELDMVAVVVTRWFGGTLLGSGGLIRAYGGTAAICLQAAETREIVPTVAMTIGVSFSDLALLKARLLAQSGVQISDESFTGSGAILGVTVATSVAEQVIGNIKGSDERAGDDRCRLKKGTASIQPVGYTDFPAALDVAAAIVRLSGAG